VIDKCGSAFDAVFKFHEATNRSTSARPHPRAPRTLIDLRSNATQIYAHRPRPICVREDDDLAANLRPRMITPYAPILALALTLRDGLPTSAGTS
jgi:hypothetical protein